MPRIAASLMVVATVVCSIGLNIHRYPVVWQMVVASGQVPRSDESSSSDTAEQTETTAESAAFSQSEAPIKAIDTAQFQDDPYVYQDDSYDTSSSSCQEDPDAYSYRDSYQEKSGAAKSEADVYSYQKESNPYQDQGDSDSQRGGIESSENPIQTYEYQSPKYASVEPSEDARPGQAGADSGLASGSRQTSVGSAPSTETEYGTKWPAEASPAAKYGSVATETEAMGDWEQEKPLVPVVRADDPQDPGPKKGPGLICRNGPEGASHKLNLVPFSAPAVGGSSASQVRRLPPIDRQRPIPTDNYANRLPESPIPVYPSTGY